MDSKMFIFGFGYTASFLVKKLAGFDIVGTSRNQESHKQSDKINFKLIAFDRINVEKHLQSVTHLLISTPPSIDSGDPVLKNFSDLIKKHAPQLTWVGYLSSTGIYGDHQGEWVDESSPSLLLGEQAQRRLSAEQDWISIANECALPLHIFRLAGIYGPKRNALARIKQGKKESIYKKNHFFSRIHVEDIASVLLASIQNPKPMSIYNLADDEPAPAYEVEEYAAGLLNLPYPKRVPFENAILSPMEREFYTHHRRVSNNKIKEELITKLNYPNYRDGLDAIYKNGDYLC